jgi:hypothetical protein
MRKIWRWIIPAWALACSIAVWWHPADRFTQCLMFLLLAFYDIITSTERHESETARPGEAEERGD